MINFSKKKIRFFYNVWFFPPYGIFFNLMLPAEEAEDNDGGCAVGITIKYLI